MFAIWASSWSAAPAAWTMAGVLGVEVRDAALRHRVALHGHAQPVAVVVEQADLALVRRRVPEDVPRHRGAGDVLLDHVVAPADAVAPDDVGHGVARALVVERVLQLGPDVDEVRQVGVVQRLQDAAGHELHDVAAAEPEDDVERHRAGRELRQRLVGRVVGGDLDAAVELGLELLLRVRVDVVGVVVDPQRAALGLLAIRDRLVVVEERPGHGVVRARQRQAAGSERLRHDERRRRSGRGVANRLGGVLARGEQPARARDGGQRPRSAQEAASRDASVLGCIGPSKLRTRPWRGATGQR